MKTSSVELILCPMCESGNLVAEVTTKKRKTHIDIHCSECDLYPDKIISGCYHPNDGGFNTDHGGESMHPAGCAVRVTFTKIKL